MMKLKLYTFFLLVFSSFSVLAQLSDLHYLPPLKQASGAFTSQALYISTPETTPFSVKVYQGNSTVELATLTVSNANTAVYNFTNGGDNDITLVSNSNTGVILNNSGLRLESANGQKFYVNWRGKSASQASSLTSKGRVALGTAFKWGGVPNKGTNYTILNSSLGIMATEDNTVINIFGYNPNCTFRSPSSATGITDDAIKITLNAGQTYVLEATITGAGSANVDGWLGASIISNKNIAVNIGEMHFQPSLVSNQDCAIDQIIPENSIGRDYIFVRGNGVNATEFPVIVATQNDTKIYVNGSTTPLATINNGDYFAIPSTFYSSSSTTSSVPGANMLVQTSQPAYAFQSLAGSSGTETVDINFIAPVNCLLSNKVDNIPDITNLVGTTINGGVTIIASSRLANSDIIVKYGNNIVPVSTLNTAEKAVAGDTNWKTFYLPGLSGNVSVNSIGPLAVGFFGFNGAAGASGYFSGFETIPTIQVKVNGNGCLPGTVLTATAGFTSYAWYNNGILVPGETSNTFTPTTAGSYNVVVSNGSCTYESAPQTVADCNPEVVLSITSNTKSAKPGNDIVFNISVKFLGYDQINNLVISNLIPTGLTVKSTTSSYGTWSGSGQSYNWNIGKMFAGENHTLTVVTTVNNITSSGEVTYRINNIQIETDGNKVADDLSESVLLYLKTLPTLGTFADFNKILRDGSFIISDPKSNGTGNFTYTSSNPSVASISDKTVILNSVGTTIITATQAGDTNYDIGFITAKLTVNPSSEILTNKGEISTTKLNFINSNGAIGSKDGITASGKIKTAKSPLITEQNLLLWLEAGETSSYNGKDNVWYDLTNNRINGIQENKLGYSASNSVNSFYFNGTNNYLSFIDGYSSTDDITYETWLFPTSFSTDFNAICNHNGWEVGMAHLQFSNGKLFLSLNNANQSPSNYNFTTNKWYHITVVYSKSAQSVKYYVNGILTNVVATGVNAPTIINRPFKIGSWDGSSRFFNGNIASFKIYSRVLSDNEVLKNFNTAKARFGVN